jgi:hypothetical protein
MAIVVVSIQTGDIPKFLVGKESRFLRDVYPELSKLEKFQLPGDYMAYYTKQCKRLSRRYGMRIQFDTPDVYADHTRARFRYLEKDWKYGVVKGTFSTVHDTTTFDTAVREFSEEVMKLNDVTGIRDLNTKIHLRDLYSLHFQDSTDLYTAIARRTNMYYGELFDIQFMSWEEIRALWRGFNLISKRALELIVSSEQSLFLT